MASDLNDVKIIGRLVREPELKSTNSGTFFCNFTLASNTSIKDGNGGFKDDVGFFDCTAWGKSAETINKYVKKGDRFLVAGRLKFNSWENAEGKKMSKIGVSVEFFQFLQNKRDDSGPSNSGAQGSYDGRPSDDEIPF